MYYKHLAAICILTLGTPNLATGRVLLYDFETEDQHREYHLDTNPNTPPGWGSFGQLTTDRGPSLNASAGEWGRFHAGDFDLPADLPGNYGLVSVSDRFVPNRKDFSGFIGISIDMRFNGDHPTLPYFGAAEVQIGFGFIVPGIGEDEDLQAYADPITLTDTYQTYEIYYDDIPFVQSGATLVNDLANNAFLKIRFANTEENYGRAAFYWDEVYGILGSSAVDDADFNGDEVVDGSDFLIWQRGFGLEGQIDNSLGDANGDGSINGADLAIWEGQFGHGLPLLAAVAVPESQSVVLAMLALLATTIGMRVR